MVDNVEDLCINKKGEPVLQKIVKGHKVCGDSCFECENKAEAFKIANETLARIIAGETCPYLNSTKYKLKGKYYLGCSYTKK